MSLPGANTTDPTQLDPPPTGPAQWAARVHGRLLSGCLVTLNILLVLLFYFYFWRIFWKKPASPDPTEPNPAATTSNSSRSSASSSPGADHHLRKTNPEVVAGLPVFVHSSTTSPNAAECAVCLAEFRDGDRGRVLPRCGHRFHLECVDMWAQFHTTCPLCRASLEPESDPAPDSAV